MQETVRLNTQLTKEQHGNLLRLQKATGTKLSWLVQQAIAQYLASRKKELK